MAALSTTKKVIERKLYLQVCPHSVSIEFQPNAASLSASLPALFLRLSHGSRATESTPAKLQEGYSGYTTYRASWNKSALPLNLALSQDASSGEFQNKEIELQLKVPASEGINSHKSLASYTYDVTCLNLAALNYAMASSETRQIFMSTGKSAAAAAIRAVTLEATFHYRFLHDNFDISVEHSRSRETSPHARSPPPNVDVVDIPHPMSAFVDPQSTTVDSSQGKGINTETKTVYELKQHDGEINHEHLPVGDTPDAPVEGRRRIQSTLSTQSASRLHKSPKKKFQWFKKVKSVSQRNSASHEASRTLNVTVSGTVSSSIEMSDLVQDLSAHASDTTQISKLEEIQHGPFEPPHSKEIGIPPKKPKRKLKAANINPDPHIETVSEDTPDENVIPGQIQRNTYESNCLPHMPLTKPLPLQQKHIYATFSSEGSDDEESRSFSLSLETKKQVMKDHKASNSNKTDQAGGMREAQEPLIPKHYRHHSRSSPTPPTGGKMQGLSKHISGSTPHLLAAKLVHGRRSSSLSHITASHKDKSSPVASISEFIKPTAHAIHSYSTPNASARPSSDQHLGILKVCLKAVDTSDDFKSHASNGQSDHNKESPGRQEGLCCVFTIGGGSGQFMSTVQPLVSQRTTLWDDSQEFLFYATPQSKKLFVLCRRTTFESVPEESESSSQTLNVHDGKCIGVAALEIATVRNHSSSPVDDVSEYLAHVECRDYKLAMQPKGTMLLQSCLYVLQPRSKVTCTGTVTIQTLSGLGCNPDHHISCTVKIDSNFQDDTEPQPLEQCASGGWRDQPVNFRACNSLDCSIQAWAYSTEETEYWCGGCVVPLAMLLQDGKIFKHTANGDQANKSHTSTHIVKTISLPLEPKGIIRLFFSLEPSIQTSGHAPFAGDLDGVKALSIAADQSLDPEPRPTTNALVQLLLPRVSDNKRGSLRRITMRKAGGFNLKVLKSYSEEPFNPEDDKQMNGPEEQIADLRNEVEFLREELRQTKAKLAESEFYREQAQLELKTLQKKCGNSTHTYINSTKSPKKRKQ